MNIVDAVKTKRPIRRPGGGWIEADYLLETFSRGDLRPFSKEDFLADDWEIKEEPTTVTAKQFWDAAAALGLIIRYDGGVVYVTEDRKLALSLQRLAIKLGIIKRQETGSVGNLQ